MCSEVDNLRSSISFVYYWAFHCLKGLINSLSLVTFIFPTKEVLNFGKNSGSGERPFPSKALENASWRCCGHTGPLHQEEILSGGPELGKNGEAAVLARRHSADGE